MTVLLEGYADALAHVHDHDGLARIVLDAALLVSGGRVGAVLLGGRDRPGGPYVLLGSDDQGQSSRGSQGRRARHAAGRRVAVDGGLEVSADGGASGPGRHLVLLGEQALVDGTPATTPQVGDLGPAAVVPMTVGERVVGAVVVVRAPSMPPPDARALATLEALASTAGSALVEVERLTAAERLALTDPSTGLGTPRHLGLVLSREVSRAMRFGRTLAVLVVELEGFDQLAARHGAAAAASVLQVVAARLKDCVREVDTVARYGRASVCVVLPETDVGGAQRLARRLDEAVRAEPVALAGATGLTVRLSAGAAELPRHGTTEREVLAAAATALAAARSGHRGGPGRPVGAGPVPVAGRPRGAGGSAGAGGPGRTGLPAPAAATPVGVAPSGPDAP